MIGRFFESLWNVWLEAAPWLVLGLLVAGALKVWLPATRLRRWLGPGGLWSVVKAAVIGTPLPLCSCSVLPAAVGLRRAGASKGSTVSFLVATPENGADSLALSYALLGPFMTIVRPIAAIGSALVAGLLAERADDDAGQDAPAASASGDTGGNDHCSSMSNAAPEPATGESCCCGGSNPAAVPAEANGDHCDASKGQSGASDDQPGFASKLALSVRYGLFDLFDDIAGWLVVGLVIAAAISAVVQPEALTEWGSGLGAMLIMLVVGIPMYICATASTPVAAAMLAAGVSPGTVLVFLLAGPASNIGSIGVIRKELGTRAVIGYLVGVAGGALAFGLLTDLAAGWIGVDVVESAAHAHEVAPGWLAGGCAIFLLLLLARIVWKRIARLMSGSPAASCCASGSGEPAEHQTSSCCGGSGMPKRGPASCCSSEAPKPAAGSSCCGGAAPAEAASCCGDEPKAAKPEASCCSSAAERDQADDEGATSDDKDRPAGGSCCCGG